MTEEDLVDLLRKNLRIELSSKDGSCYGSASIEINIYWGDSWINSSSCSLPEENRSSFL